MTPASRQQVLLLRSVVLYCLSECCIDVFLALLGEPVKGKGHHDQQKFQRRTLRSGCRPELGALMASMVLGERYRSSAWYLLDFNLVKTENSGGRGVRWKV